MGFEDTLREVAFGIVRFLSFSSHAVLFGMPLILLIVLRPAFAGLDERWDEGRSRLSRRLEGVVRAALVASAVATLIGLLLQAIIVAGLEETDLQRSQFESVAGTTFGQWYMLRFPILAGLYVLLTGQVSRWALDRSRTNRVWWGAWIALALVLLSTSTLTGHAAVSDPLALGIPNDVVHLVAGSVWFSGIVLLAVYLPDGWLGKDESQRLQLLAPVVVRFSLVALTSITIVAVTGTLNSYLNIARFADLFESGYGRSLLLKLALFGVILLMGAVNHFVLRERIRKAEVVGTRSPAHATFRKTIAIELVVAIGIMGATGLLTGQAKTRQRTFVENGEFTSPPTP